MNPGLVFFTQTPQWHGDRLATGLAYGDPIPDGGHELGLKAVLARAVGPCAQRSLRLRSPVG
jgi:hypothetical protein